MIAALGGAKVFDAPPHGQSGDGVPPYITLGDETVSDWSTQSDEGAIHDLTITLWSAARGFAETKTAMAAFYDALHEETLAVGGGRMVSLRFVSAETGRTRSRLRRADCVFRALVEIEVAA